MDKITKLKAARAAVLDRMDGIVATATAANRDLTAEERAALDVARAEDDGLAAQIATLEDLERRRAATATASAPIPAAATTVPATASAPRDQNFEVGAFIRSYAQAQLAMRNGVATSAARVAAELYGERAPVTESISAAQTASDNAGGGFLIPPTLAPGIIDRFTPRTVVRKRATVVPGNAIYLRGLSVCSVDYIGENEQPDTTGTTFGTITMSEKDFGAILPISKKLLRNTSFGVEAYCSTELVKAAAVFEDRKFLYGTGTGKQVQGYKFAIPKPHKIAAADKVAPTNQEVRADLRKVLKALAEADIPLDQNSPAWLMSPLVKMYLEDLYQGDLKAFPTLEGPNPTLMGYPVETTTLIAGPAGTGGDVFFGAHAFAMIGETVSMRLETSDTASFKDQSGSLVNLWAQDMLGVKLVMSHDFALRHAAAFAMLSGVKWGQ
ncbi:phage major capsid protein [Magnetospirillum molischianum]|uniref:Putative Phage major capsid protein, HK97 n=1 Tax=Magnetospirillum molischianum DSM 120 TaxID=1150626 RepID=H8FUY9_MAGML|nr:phage major capsid protein [Magnetospirillum molischianum]CCG42177.1 putative Phage major capsid protein, HK97 [Magnetospirillum molischianum DSM 120]